MPEHANVGMTLKVTQGHQQWCTRLPITFSDL